MNTLTSSAAGGCWGHEARGLSDKLSPGLSDKLAAGARPGEAAASASEAGAGAGASRSCQLATPGIQAEQSLHRPGMRRIVWLIPPDESDFVTTSNGILRLKVDRDMRSDEN